MRTMNASNADTASTVQRAVRKRKTHRCPVAGCTAVVQNLKRHAMVHRAADDKGDEPRAVGGAGRKPPSFPCPVDGCKAVRQRIVTHLISTHAWSRPDAQQEKERQLAPDDESDISAANVDKLVMDKRYTISNRRKRRIVSDDESDVSEYASSLDADDLECAVWVATSDEEAEEAEHQEVQSDDEEVETDFDEASRDMFETEAEEDDEGAEDEDEESEEAEDEEEAEDAREADDAEDEEEADDAREADDAEDEEKEAQRGEAEEAAGIKQEAMEVEATHDVKDIRTPNKCLDQLLQTGNSMHPSDVFYAPSGTQALKRAAEQQETASKRRQCKFVIHRGHDGTDKEDPIEVHVPCTVKYVDVKHENDDDGTMNISLKFRTQ